MKAQNLRPRQKSLNLMTVMKIFSCFNHARVTPHHQRYVLLWIHSLGLETARVNNLKGCTYRQCPCCSIFLIRECIYFTSAESSRITLHISGVFVSSKRYINQNYPIKTTNAISQHSSTNWMTFLNIPLTWYRHNKTFLKGRLTHHQLGTYLVHHIFGTQ